MTRVLVVAGRTRSKECCSERANLLNIQELKKELRKDPASLKARYDTLEAEQQIIVALLDLRRAQNLTQKQLAELMGTSQANISKLENGKFNPSVAFLKRLAAACDVRLDIHLR